MFKPFDFPKVEEFEQLISEAEAKHSEQYNGLIERLDKIIKLLEPKKEKKSQ